MEHTINYMEIWVKDCMERLLKDCDVCKCKKCKTDIYTLSLNNLKPFYVSTEEGRVLTKINGMQQQLETDIIIQITKAINIVKQNPKHNK